MSEASSFLLLSVCRYDMLKIESHSEAQITSNLATHYQNGVRVRLGRHVETQPARNLASISTSVAQLRR